MFEIHLASDFETLTISLPEGQELDDDVTEDEVFEALTANSGLHLIPEGTISGDLTSAPCLAVLSEQEPGDAGDFSNAILAGHWEGRPWRHRVIARWGFMSYEVTGVADQLRENGKAVFTGGLVWPEPDDLLVDNSEFRDRFFAALMDRKLDYWHDKVSDLLEDPDSDDKKLRKAVARLLVRLNALHERKQAALVQLLGPRG